MPPKKSSNLYKYPPEDETKKVAKRWLDQFSPGEPIPTFCQRYGSGKAMAEFKELVKQANGGTLPDNATDVKLRKYLSKRISEKAGIRVLMPNSVKQIGDKAFVHALCVECEKKEVSVTGTMCTECTAQTHNIEMSTNGQVCTYDDPFS